MQVNREEEREAGLHVLDASGYNCSCHARFSTRWEAAEHATGVLTGPDHLNALEWQLYELVPPIDPPALHWLDSDATFSYCWPCARKARWQEMGNVGEPPLEADWWTRDPIEENIRSGIDGGFDSSPSDTPESCETCGCTLRHTLTDYGVSSELDHFAENPGFAFVTGEQTYTISRICLNLTWSGADAREVAEATKIVEDALQVARTQGNQNG